MNFHPRNGIDEEIEEEKEEEEPTEEVIPPDPEELEEQVAGEVWVFHARDMCRFIHNYVYILYMIICISRLSGSIKIDVMDR